MRCGEGVAEDIVDGDGFAEVPVLVAAQPLHGLDDKEEVMEMPWNARAWRGQTQGEWRLMSKWWEGRGALRQVAPPTVSGFSGWTRHGPLALLRGGGGLAFQRFPKKGAFYVVWCRLSS
jgi:hypothetical protein